MKDIRQAAVWTAATLASCVAVLPAVAAPPNAHAVVAVYPPWWDSRRALAAAQIAAPAVPARAPFAVLVPALDSPGLDRLRRSGALLVLNADLPWCSTEAKGP